jgi:hypothetical protein
MNPGPSEEIGSTARSLIEGLKGQPAVLALTIANLALLVFIYYALHQSATFRENLMNRVLANAESIHKNTIDLQSRSIACPDPTFRLQSDESKPAPPPEPPTPM